MASTKPILNTWPQEQIERFKNRYAEGASNADLASEFGISRTTVWKIEKTLGLIGTREPGYTGLITRPIAKVIGEMYPNHFLKDIADEVEKQFGVRLATSTLSTFAMYHGFKHSEEFAKCVNQEKTKTMHKVWKEHREEILAKRGKTLSRTFASEKRRVLHGLPQRTGLTVQACPDVKRRHKVKNELCRRNNYFSLERGGRTIYYDEQTKRSRMMESKYARMFDFLPADGFNEKDSQFTAKVNYKKAQ